jgi:hypothetical protein
MGWSEPFSALNAPGRATPILAPPRSKVHSALTSITDRNTSLTCNGQRCPFAYGARGSSGRGPVGPALATEVASPTCATGGRSRPKRRCAAKMKSQDLAVVLRRDDSGRSMRAAHVSGAGKRTKRPVPAASFLSRVLPAPARNEGLAASAASCGTIGPTREHTDPTLHCMSVKSYRRSSPDLVGFPCLEDQVWRAWNCGAHLGEVADGSA